jgi:O-antigen ligase
MQLSLAEPPTSSIATLQTAQRQRDWLLFLLIFITGLGLAPLVIWAGVHFGYGTTLGILVAILIAAGVVWWPLVGFYLVAGAAVLVELEPLAQGTTPTPIFTDTLPLFYWPPGSPLEGFFERPIGLLILFTFLVILCRRFATRQRLWQGGAFLWPFVFFLLCVAGGVLHGLLTGGDPKIIVVEVRSFWYWFVAYLLACNLVSQTRHLRAFFWLVIVSAGVKAIQGIYIFIVYLRGQLPQVSLMSHEESYFFLSEILLAILLCLLYRSRPQLYAALLVLPLVLFTLVVNQRRTDYLAFLVGVAVLWLFLFIIKPALRTRLLTSAIVLAVLGAGYVALFANSKTTLGIPAHAVVSVFQPGPQHADSNLYRSSENTDLLYTTEQSPLFGLGFGKPFLQPVPLANISSLDLYYLYIPHNTILWVLMRLGAIGFLALWYLLGAIIIRGWKAVLRLRHPYLRLTALYIVGATLMEIVVAWGDQQLYDYRNVIYLGLLAGILVKLPALERQEQAQAPGQASIRQMTPRSPRA